MDEISEKIPQEVRELIDHYFNLDIGGKKVQTPYYRNKNRVRGELRVLVGKGSPAEIEEEVRIYAKLRGVDLTSLSSLEIREFMRSEAIGVDCSGYVSHILSTWVKTRGHKSLHGLIKTPPLTLFKRFLFGLRTIENISSELLTSELNCTKVDLCDVRIGDLIRLKGVKQGHHIAIIIDVTKKDGKMIEITYTHSSERYAPEEGVRIAKIKVLNQSKSLEDQKWLEEDAAGVNWTYKGYLTQKEDNGLRRLNFHRLLNA